MTVPNHQHLANLEAASMIVRTEKKLTVDGDNTVPDENTNGVTTLIFKAGITISSKPLPMSSKEKLDAFFQAPENRNLHLTAGGKRPCQDATMTSTLLERWKKACVGTGAQIPNEKDAMVAVQTGGVQFPGLEIRILAKVGVKLVEKPSDSTSAKYEIILIGDEEKTVKGLPPVVWIFNKLTGAGSKKGRTSTQSFTNLTYKVTEEDSVIFKSDTHIAVTIKFPAVLLKILPTNKEKAEETGGKAIKKAVESDIVDSMKAFEEAYLKWVVTE